MSKYKITGIICILIGMNERVKFDTWEFPHKTQRVHSAWGTHAYITQLYIMTRERKNVCISPHIHTCTRRPCVLHYYVTTTRLHYSNCSEQTLEIEDMPLTKISVHALKWIMPHASWGWVDWVRLSYKNLGYCPTHDHLLCNTQLFPVRCKIMNCLTRDHLLSNSQSSTLRHTIISSCPTHYHQLSASQSYIVRHAAIIYGPIHDQLNVRHAII